MEEEKTEENISDSVSSEITKYKKKRNDMIVEFSLLLILGILLGVTLKTEAVKKITIGFNDYKLAHARQAFDVTAMQKELMDQAAQQQAAQQLPSDQGAAQPVPDGGSTPQQQ